VSCKLVGKTQNNLVNNRNESFIAGFDYRYESFVVEKREETLLYDAGSFLAAGRKSLLSIKKLWSILNNNKDSITFEMV
jgi:hypothetical protein